MKSKDEAYIMADAFRIAFEQQLMHRKDQALRLAEVIKIKKGTKLINWRRLKEDGNCICNGGLEKKSADGHGQIFLLHQMCLWSNG